MATGIRLYGSGKDALLEQKLVAIRSLRTAIEDFQKDAPHPRDYSSTDTWATAREIHERRRSLLNGVLRGMEHESEEIADL